ncbi:MerR family transcriptional regulator [Acidicapsa dinghuensis]|uniref:MerR family transcriptional regulator n=1 Tax=Acidicapsa dinghuensis TaxID=2218256 RepID=A0ABW1E9T3_9BACT|nr:MerR family transcriptional regulator [Acidicapsa dinghuensis]
MLRIQQFAKLANVTVRTLHHYDRIGLLSPTLRSANGYRLYRMEDLAQLERILFLRYLGISLREIADLLATGAQLPEQDLAATLARQASVLRQRRDGIDRVLHAIDRASTAMKKNDKPDWSLYQTILEEIHMQETQDWTQKYYSPEAQQAIEERRPLWNPEMQAKVTADWQQMYADVQSAIDRNVEPVSDEGKALAARWMKLVEGFTGGNPAVLEGLNKLYADRANWPSGTVSPEAEKNMPKPELMIFIRAALGKA